MCISLDYGMAIGIGQFTPGVLSGADTRTTTTTSANRFYSPYETIGGTTYTLVDRQVPYFSLSEGFARKASESGISVSQVRGVGTVVTPGTFTPTTPTAGEIDQYKAGNYVGASSLFGKNQTSFSNGGLTTTPLFPILLVAGLVLLSR